MNPSLGIIILIVCLAAFIHGMSGFGFGLVAMPLLLFTMPYPAAVVLVAVLGMGAFILQFHRHRTHYSWRKGLGLVIGSAVGVPIGVFLLVHVSKALLLRGLGAVLCLTAINELVLNGRWQAPIPAWCGFPFGVASGAMSGAFNMGGPMAVAYLYTQPWTKEQIVVMIQVVLGVSGIMRLLALWQAHLITTDLLQLSLWTAGPMLLGLLLGSYLFHRVSDRYLKKGVCLALGLLGLKYLLFP